MKGRRRTAYTLGELVDIRHGFAFEGRYFRDEPTRNVLLTPGNFAVGGGFKGDKLKYYEGPVPEDFVLDFGDLLITMTDLSKAADTLGYPALVPHDPSIRYLHNQRLGKVVIKDGALVDRQFLYYLLRSNEYRHEVLAGATGTTVKHTSPERIKRFRTMFPPVPEQRAIAAVLAFLGDKIDLNRRTNETLEGIARAIFRSWFVDFDPVRAKAEGRQPAGMDAETAAVLSSRFEDSELGKIPAGWAVRTIEELANRVGIGPFGSSIKVSTFVPQGVPVISGQHLNGFMLDDHSFNFISDQHAERLKNAIVFHGDVVFTHAGNIGQVAFIPENSQYERYILSQRQFYLRCDPLKSTPSFITYYFKSPEGQFRLLANTSSSGVPSIARPVTYLRSIRLITPPKPLMDAFEAIVRPIHLQYRVNLSQDGTLASLRDALLPKLLSGELRIRDAEKMVEADV